MTDPAAPSSAPAPSRPDLGAIELRLAAAEGALSRIEDGSYGRCGACGRPVPDEQLSEDPLAVLCAECAPRVERAAAEPPGAEPASAGAAAPEPVSAGEVG